MRFTACLALLAVAGCSNSSGIWQDSGDEMLLEEHVPDPTPPDFDPMMYEGTEPYELDPGTTRPAAKTVDWPEGGSEEGETWLGGRIVLDAVFRHDADDFFGVRLRLKNRTEAGARIEWKIAFYDADGRRLIGLQDFNGDQEVFRPAALDPLDTLVISNASRLRGATTFRLFVRAGGAINAGLPDGEKADDDAEIEDLD